VNHKHDSEDSYSDPEDFPGDLDFSHDETAKTDDFFPDEAEYPTEDSL
jgi:hypothetical protein